MFEEEAGVFVTDEEGVSFLSCVLCESTSPRTVLELSGISLALRSICSCERFLVNGDMLPASASGGELGGEVDSLICASDLLDRVSVSAYVHVAMCEVR